MIPSDLSLSPSRWAFCSAKRSCWAIKRSYWAIAAAALALSSAVKWRFPDAGKKAIAIVLTREITKYSVESRHH
ncbi:hypothetical protein [Microcystis aeruginosa]|uniref:hypothetical protein n=1 Tax=Microcystis aeruginosa TaxID=1126 RepID=UPI00232DAD50|nr:hypothetical protein [Microcystis aeruginosa]MDB9390834.1 hypothetical protein [Microcystis aeruginosa CS-579]